MGVWWPYLFMVGCLISFICLLLIVCRKKIGKRYKSRHRHRRRNTEHAAHGGDTNALPATVTSEVRRSAGQGQSGDIEVTYTHGSAVVVPSGGGVWPDFAGPSDYGFVPPPYTDKPPRYEDIFPQTHGDRPIPT